VIVVGHIEIVDLQHIPLAIKNKLLAGLR